MLTRIDLDSSYSLKLGTTTSMSSEKRTEVLWNNNHQEDYVKMTAKLV